MNFTKATVSITGIAPLSQSRFHGEEKLEGESAEAYDIRTWPKKLTTEDIDGKPQVVIPVFGMHTAIANAAKYSKRQIPGQGKATWTAKFKSGIMPIGPISLGITPEEVKPIVVYVNADGIRGSGKRVLRRFPQISSGWAATFDVIILDPIITEDIFKEMLDLTGLFIGLGQYRPENGGSNGRFRVDNVLWQDERVKVRKAVV